MQNEKNESNYIGSSKGDAQSQVALRAIDFLSGCVAGVAQVLIVQPFDTIKVKQQTFPTLYRGMIDCFMKTFQNEGCLHGLYSGTVPALVANVGESSVLFAAYGGCRNAVAYLMGIEHHEDLPLFGEALAGSFGSFFSTFVLCPTELVKCKLQAINEMRLMSTNARNRFIQKMTLGKIIRKIYLADGIKGFFRGFNITVVREMPGYFFFFGCYEGTRKLFTKPGESRDDVGFLVTIFAGALAGIMLWAVTFPADVIKSRIQVNNLSVGFISVGKDIVREEGYRALYNGLLPTIIRTIPGTATLFIVYENTKKSLKAMFGL